MQLHELACIYMSLHAVPWIFMMFNELTWSSIRLHAVSWACMQFLYLSEQLTRISQCLLKRERDKSDMKQIYFSYLRSINYSKDDEMINVWIKRQVSTKRNSQNYQERVREWESEGARCLTIWIIKISVRSFITNIFDNILRGCDLWYNLDSLNIECIYQEASIPGI